MVKRRKKSRKMKIPISRLNQFSQRPSFIPEKRWKGSGFYYKHSTSGKWVRYSKTKDLARGKIGVVGLPKRVAHRTDKNLTLKKRTRRKKRRR